MRHTAAAIRESIVNGFWYESERALNAKKERRIEMQQKSYTDER